MTELSSSPGSPHFVYQSSTTYHFWRLDSCHFTIDKSNWANDLDETCTRCSNILGLGHIHFSIKLDSLLMFKKGSFLKELPESINKSFRTVFLRLPPKYKGGAMNLRHKTQFWESTNFGSPLDGCRFIALYNDTDNIEIYIVERVRSGHMACLIYHLVADNTDDCCGTGID